MTATDRIDIVLQFLRRPNGKIDRLFDVEHILKERMTTLADTRAGTDRPLAPIEMRGGRMERQLNLVELH
jgi:hypothetical protein